jgi:hypothetical protein
MNRFEIWHLHQEEVRYAWRPRNAQILLVFVNLNIVYTELKDFPRSQIVHCQSTVMRSPETRVVFLWRNSGRHGRYTHKILIAIARAAYQALSLQHSRSAWHFWERERERPTRRWACSIHSQPGISESESGLPGVEPAAFTLSLAFLAKKPDGNANGVRSINNVEGGKGPRMSM